MAVFEVFHFIAGAHPAPARRDLGGLVGIEIARAQWPAHLVDVRRQDQYHPFGNGRVGMPSRAALGAVFIHVLANPAQSFFAGEFVVGLLLVHGHLLSSMIAMLLRRCSRLRSYPTN